MSFASPTDRYIELVRQFPLRPITSKADAAAATAILDKLFIGAERPDADRGEREYVHVLTDLLHAYESEHDLDSIAAMVEAERVTGRELLKHLMENVRMSQAELGKLLGIGPAAVSMILSGERSITAEHARALAKRFKIELGAFIK